MEEHDCVVVVRSDFFTDTTEEEARALAHTRALRMSDLQCKALELRLKRHTGALEAAASRRQRLESALLDAERRFREERRARKRAEAAVEASASRRDDAMRDLATMTAARLRLSQDASAATESVAHQRSTMETLRRDTLSELRHDLALALADAAAARAQFAAYDSLVARGETPRHVLAARLALRHEHDAHARSLAAHASQLRCHLDTLDLCVETQAKHVASLVDQTAADMAAAQAELDARKKDITCVDQRLARVLETLEDSRSAHRALTRDLHRGVEGGAAMISHASAFA